MTQKQFLIDTLNYYTCDVTRRAYNELEKFCEYKTSDGRKCAIGRFIPDDKYDKSIEGNSIDSKNINIKNILPIEIQNLGTDFLLRVQQLHDSQLNWDENRLTLCGISRIKTIIKNFNLNENDFEKFLK